MIKIYEFKVLITKSEIGKNLNELELWNEILNIYNVQVYAY